MINIPNSVKNEYKDFNREIKVYGILYIATKRISKNLFDYRKTTPGWINKNNVIQQSGLTTYCYSDYCKVEPNTTYSLNLYNKTGLQDGALLEYNNSKSFLSLYTLETYTPMVFTTSANTYYIRFTCRQDSQSKVQLEKGFMPSNYEEYGTYVIDYNDFDLTEENESEILSFNINEKADVYYTSVPYNTMTIEVNNERGYFTDYDPDSIIDKLNEDCYVDLYMQINNGNYYKIMTMNFDKIKYSDYEKAKLSFYSNIAILEKLELRDKYEELRNGIAFFSEFKSLIENNYNINIFCDHPDKDVQSFICTDKNCNSLRDFIITNATFEFGEIYGAGILLTNDFENNLSFKAISNIVNDTISTDLQLEKPSIRKENTYQGVKYNWHSINNYEQTGETYIRTIHKTLMSSRDVIVIEDKNYRLSDITINDITSSSNVSVSLGQIASYIKDTISLVVSGNIGEEYDITISKSNIYRNVPNDFVIWPLGNTSETSKILEIQDNSSVQNGMNVFLFVKKPMKSYVEIRIMGLPYLEIGDTLLIELENRSVKIFIIEIDTTYNNGLLQTIKGYELDWTHQSRAGYYDDLNDWDI